MSRKPTVFSLDKVEKAISKIEARAAIPKGLNCSEIIEKAQSQIQSALESGYSFEDVAQIFSEEGITIPASRIKTEFSRVRKNKVKKISKIDKAKPEKTEEISKLSLKPENSNPENLFQRENANQGTVANQFNLE